MKAVEAYILAKKYAEKVAMGIGSMSVSGTTVTFTLTDGSTASVTLPTPADGLSPTAGWWTTDGRLIIQLSDNSEIDCGRLQTRVDTTLTQSGTAADAKTVGDKVNDLDFRLTDVEADVAQIQIDLTTLETKVDDEITRSTDKDSDLQTQIDRLQGKQQFLGSVDCAAGVEQSVLTQSSKDLTGDTDRPLEGDTITILTDGAGTSRNEQWTYTVIKDASGNVLSNKWVMSYGPPIVMQATTTTLGVVKVPSGGGISVDANGAIRTNKNLIGLGNVDNVRQYSTNNPAPLIVTVDGKLYTGDTNSGISITTGAVRYDGPQVLTNAQKAVARENIGINGAIPTKTSELINDSNFIADANYVHTDNNYTDADKAQIAKNKADITTIKTEQITQNEEIENLKKKSYS